MVGCFALNCQWQLHHHRPIQDRCAPNGFFVFINLFWFGLDFFCHFHLLLACATVWNALQLFRHDNKTASINWNYTIYEHIELINSDSMHLLIWIFKKVFSLRMITISKFSFIMLHLIAYSMISSSISI